MKRTIMVRFFYPGSLFAEEDTKAIGDRDPAKVDVPGAAFAFQFFDRVEWTGTREDGKPMSDVAAENESGKFYPGGEAFTPSELRASGMKDIQILLDNMECNDWPQVVRTRKGNFQPFNKGDEVLP